VVGLLLLNMVLARVPLKWLVVGGASFQALALALSALAGNLWALVGALAVVGLAATIPVVVPAIWIGAYAKRTAERAMMLTLVFFAGGVLATPVAIGAALALGANWRWILAGEAAFAFLTALAFLAVPLANVPGRENIRLPQFRELLRFDPRLLGVVLGAMFVYIGAEHILNIWLAEFQIETFGVGQGAAALALTLFFGGMMGGRFITVPLTRRVVAWKMLAVSGLLLALFTVLTALAPSFFVSELTIFLAGVGASPSYPLLSSYINRFPAKYSGLVYSLITLSVIVSGALFAYVVGPAAEALGMRAALALAAAPALGLVVLTFFLPRTSRASTPRA
jgi:fucose permease